MVSKVPPGGATRVARSTILPPPPEKTDVFVPSAPAPTLIKRREVPKGDDEPSPLRSLCRVAGSVTTSAAMSAGGFFGGSQIGLMLATENLPGEHPIAMFFRVAMVGTLACLGGGAVGASLGAVSGFLLGGWAGGKVYDCATNHR